MIIKQSVNQFLKELKTKMSIWGVLFIDRDKNSKTLATLEMIPIEREKILEKLEIIDYSKGPFTESQYGTENMWIFGKQYKNHEIYIKISLGHESSRALCIS